MLEIWKKNLVFLLLGILKKTKYFTKMKNISLNALSISNLLSHSPLLTFARNNMISSCLLQNSKFFKASNSIISGNHHNFYKIYSSGFNKIMNSAISLDSAQNYENKNFENQILVKNGELDVQKCTFTNCVSNRGGAILATRTNFKVSDSSFISCSANVGGAVLANLSTFIKYTKVLFFNNTANYSAATHTDSSLEKEISEVKLVNTTRNHATYWSGGMRIDRAGGKLEECYFESNSALASGAFFDFAYRNTVRHVSLCFFYNNSAEVRGGAFTCFHIMHNSTFNNCIFVKNYCKEQAHSISLETVDQRVTISNCFFDGPQEEQVSMRFGGSYLTIENNNVFDNKSVTKDHQLAVKIVKLFDQ